MDVRQQIVEHNIESLDTHFGLNDLDKAFMIFGHCLYCDISTHSFDPNDNVDGGQDKQIDCITVEEEQGEGTIYISQVKNEESFSSNAIIQIRNGLNWIFKKRKAEVATLSNEKFRDKIKECRDLLALLGPSNITVKVAYITNGLSSEISEECSQESRTILEEFDNGTFSKFTFETIGATEIVDLINSQEKKNKKIDAEIKIKYDANSPSLIKYHSHGLKGIICTTSAVEIARIVNDDPKGFVFDLNIRKYLGNLGSVNRDIRETCSNEDTGYLFWFLNNGITIVCDKVDPVTDPDDPHLKITNMQIVNGCQTSTSLAGAMREGILLDDVNVILKVFETSDLNLVDKVVLTTNNQNKITSRNLRANDKIQQDLQTAFRIYNYYYERKPRQYTDLKIPASKIVPNELVATAFLAIRLKRPSDARSRKYKIWSDYYESIFKSVNVESFLVVYLIKAIVSNYINNSELIKDDDELRRYLAKNAQFHIARIVAFIWRRTDSWNNVDVLKAQLEELNKNQNLLDKHIENGFKDLVKLITDDEKLQVDINTTLKSSAFDSRIDKMLYQKYDKSSK